MNITQSRVRAKSGMKCDETLAAPDWSGCNPCLGRIGCLRRGIDQRKHGDRLQRK
jgi:hypothetical protein